MDEESVKRKICVLKISSEDIDFLIEILDSPFSAPEDEDYIKQLIEKLRDAKDKSA